MRRVLAPLPTLVLPLVLPFVVAVALGAGGCATDGPDAAAADGDGVVVEVMIEDGEARSPVERVEVDAGEQVELVVMADSAGELHVHADPERKITYEFGTTTFALQVDRPGLVEVELHHSDQLLVQLEVR